MPSAEKLNKDKLKAEIKRTGVTPRMFFERKFFLNDSQRPAKLDRRAMNHILGGKSDLLEQESIDYIFRKYSGLTDDVGLKSDEGNLLPRRGRKFPQEGEEWITITSQMLDLLKSEFGRTGHNPRTILSDTQNIPERLNSRIIQGWFYSDITKTNSLFWGFVIDLLKRQPNYNSSDFLIKDHKPYKISKSRPNHKPLSDEDRIALKKQRDRTKVGGVILLKYANNIPKNLTPSMIAGWLSGNTKTAEPEHLKYVLALYDTLPERK